MSRLLERLKERGLVRFAAKCSCGQVVVRDLSAYPEFRMAVTEAEHAILEQPKDSHNGR